MEDVEELQIPDQFRLDSRGRVWEPKEAVNQDLRHRCEKHTGGHGGVETKARQHISLPDSEPWFSSHTGAWWGLCGEQSLEKPHFSPILLSALALPKPPAQGPWTRFGLN